jgi:hypothetical protein
VDFGEALVVIGGVEQKGHFLCMDLPQSDDCFVMASPAENTESFLEVVFISLIPPGPVRAGFMRSAK